MLHLLAALAALQPAADAPPPMERIEQAIADGKVGEIKAVIVEQGGEIIYERYFDGAKASDTHDIKSAGKSITALALGRAIGDGHVAGLDVRPLGEQDWQRDITLRDLVTMSSAMDCNDWEPKSPGQEDKMYPRDRWAPFAVNIPQDKDYARDWRGRGRFSYCTAGIFLTGQYLEKATGQRFDDYVQATLFDPLGITDVRWTRSPSGEVQSGGQLHMRPRDLVSIGRLVLDGGRHGEAQLVPAAFIDEMLTPYVRATGDADFGYLWWLGAYRHGERAVTGWSMRGNGGNHVALIEELDAVIVIVSTNYNKPGMHQISQAILQDGALPMLLAREE